MSGKCRLTQERLIYLPPILELIYFPLFQNWFYSSQWGFSGSAQLGTKSREGKDSGSCPLWVVQGQGTSGSISQQDLGSFFTPPCTVIHLFPIFINLESLFIPHSRREQKEFSPGTISEYLYRVLLFCQIIIFIFPPVSYFIGLKLKLFRAFSFSCFSLNIF